MKSELETFGQKFMTLPEDRVLDEDEGDGEVASVMFDVEDSLTGVTSVLMVVVVVKFIAIPGLVVLSMLTCVVASDVERDSVSLDEDDDCVETGLIDDGGIGVKVVTELGSSVMGSTVMGSPVMGSLVMGSLVMGSVMGFPVIGSPVIGFPVIGSPVIGSPVMGSPV